MDGELPVSFRSPGAGAAKPRLDGMEPAAFSHGLNSVYNMKGGNQDLESDLYCNHNGPEVGRPRTARNSAMDMSFSEGEEVCVYFMCYLGLGLEKGVR